MKKMTVLAAVLFTCLFAHADWLYWTLDFSDSAAGVNPVTVADGTLSVYLMSGGAVASEGDTLAAGKSVMGGGEPQIGEMEVDGTPASYYFEMRNASNAAVYMSDTFGYGLFSAYVTSELYDKSNVWNAAVGTTWMAVPEPTSGLLVLIGLAGLALKRKRA